MPDAINCSFADAHYSRDPLDGPVAKGTEADQIKALSAEGLSMGAIALKLRVGKGSMHRVLKAPDRVS